MITLPITCNQTKSILVGLIVLGAIISITHGLIYDEKLTLAAGVVTLSVFGVFLMCYGIVYIIIWIEDNVDCKCDK